MEIVVILRNIRSLYNVGSIFRTADAAGVKKIYLCGITPTPLDRFDKIRPQFSKVSLGAENYVNFEKVASTTALIKKLNREGYKVLAIEQNKKSTPYYKFKLGSAKKIALVLGNEVRGLSKAILSKCNKILEIPMRGKKESLNVGVAFGVIIFTLRYN